MPTTTETPQEEIDRLLIELHAEREYSKQLRDSIDAVAVNNLQEALEAAGYEIAALRNECQALTDGALVDDRDEWRRRAQEAERKLKQIAAIVSTEPDEYDE